MNPTGTSHFNQARIEWAIRLRYSPMPKLDVEWLASNLNAFRIGELRVVGKIWETMMERDGELAVNADKRASDLAGLEWSVVSDGSADGDRHCEAMTYFYGHLRATHALDQDVVGGMGQLLYQMASAHSYYYSAHEMLLRVDDAGSSRVTAEFRHTPIWFFESRRGYLGYLQHIFDMYGQPCLEGEWLTCVGAGWMRPLCMAYAFKWFPMADWALWCRRYGSGFLEGITGDTKGDVGWNEALEALQTLANDGAVLHNKSVEMKFLEQSSRNEQPFESLVNLADRLYAKCYRGVDLATGSRASGGGGGKPGSQNPVGASIQSEETGIFLLRDAGWATGYLNERVDRPVLRYLFNQEPRAWVKVAAPAADTDAEDLAALQVLVPLGFRVSLADCYDRFGWDPPAEGEPCLTPPMVAAPASGEDDPNKPSPKGPSPVAAATPTSAARGKPKSADESEEETQTAIDPIKQPIGAGADPKAMVQTASRQMPDPQPDEAGFWSAVGAARRAVFGPFSKGKKAAPRMSDGTLPALAVAVPNEAIDRKNASAAAAAPKPSEEFEQVSRERLAAATHEDMAHAAEKVKALLQITDPEHFAARANEVLGEWDSMTANTLMVPKAADALAPIIGTAFATGLQRPSAASLENWDPDQPRDRLGQWVDENGGSLSVRNNIKRGKRATELGLNQKSDVQKAMYRKGAGEIIFPYGRPGHTQPNAAGATHTDGYGLSHFAVKHPDKLRDLPVTIAKGRIVPHDSDPEKKLYIVHKDDVAVLSRYNEANDKISRHKTWAVTHLEDRRKVEQLQKQRRPSWMTGAIEGR